MGHIAHDYAVEKDAMEIACAKLIGPEGIVGQRCWVGAKASIVESRRIGEGATVGIGIVATK